MLDLGVGRRLALGELGEQVIVVFGDGFDHLFAILFGPIDEVGRNIDGLVFRAQGFIEPD